MVNIMEPGNPPKSKTWPYALTLVGVPALSLVCTVMVSTIRPGVDNSALVTQILGYGALMTGVIMTYLKSSDAKETVNSRMDEFKRTIQLSADVAVAKALSEGRAQGREQANSRTDALAQSAVKE